MTRLLKRRALRGAALLVAVCGIGAAGPATMPAMAGIEAYCAPSSLTTTVYSIGYCAGARHSLTSNRVWPYYGGSHYVGAEARDTSFNEYGTWIYGAGYACHPYSGANLLYPIVGNFEFDTYTFAGGMYYGVDRWC